MFANVGRDLSLPAHTRMTRDSPWARLSALQEQLPRTPPKVLPIGEIVEASMTSHGVGRL